MSFGEKLKLLRKEKGWSQDELAFNAQIDGRQVSRYENDRVNPSIEVAIKVAKTFDVSLDYLLLENQVRKPLSSTKLATSKLTEKLMSVETLSEDDERSLLHLLDAIDAKNRFKSVLANVR